MGVGFFSFQDHNKEYEKQQGRIWDSLLPSRIFMQLQQISFIPWTAQKHGMVTYQYRKKSNH